MSLVKIISLSCVLSIFVMGLDASSMARAEGDKTPQIRSTNLMGMVGLNVLPTSRMDKTGTMRLGVGVTDPYSYSFLGFQIADPLYVSLRETGEVSSLIESPKRLYSGLDFKLRLAQETNKRPEISIGANSAFGHKRTSSEYVVFSKRKNNFDFTAGMAWGRLAGKGHIKNPLRAVSSHFGENRNFNDEDAQNTDDWLTGQEIGLFGGVEYFTPLKGLSLKAGYGAYDYTPEASTNAGFNEAQPWSLGVNYKPWQQADLSVGIIGGEKMMGRLSLQGGIQNWKGRPSPSIKPPKLVSPRDDETGGHEMRLNLLPHQSTGRQVGHAARLVANQMPKADENIEIALNHKGLKGPNLRLIRRDIEEAILNNHGSAEEIWRDVRFLPNKTSPFDFKGYFKNKEYKKIEGRFILDNKISFLEEDSSALYRSSLILETQQYLPFGLMLGVEPKINLADNIARVRFLRAPQIKSVRGNEPDFAGQRFAMNRLYASWLYSISQNTHINMRAGHLEEMFAGYGGEILYRPFGKTFAIGAEGWNVRKRNPFKAMSLGVEKKQNFTGHLNLFYELHNKDVTFYAKAGRYLAQDSGVTFGVKNRFKNGTSLEGFITATNEKDDDIFGGSSQAYGGVKFTLPFGNVPFVPKGSEVRVTAAPMARDAGQVLDAPNKLYDVTEPVSYRRLSQSWSDLLH